MRYKVTVVFSGTVVVEMDAASPEAARLAVAEMTLPDLAKQGQADVHALKIAAREITPTASLSGEDDGEGSTAPRAPRPSGWYRPA